MVKARKIEITQQELKEVLEYSSETGALIWRISPVNSVKIGATAGSKQSSGYLTLMYKGKAYKAHGLAWLYMYGEISEDKYVDHIDGNKSNNTIANLRLCTQLENNKNRRLNSNNTSGYKGVNWNKKDCNWQANASLNGKIKYLGSYATSKDASIAYESYCALHHGDFYLNTTKETNG